MAKLLFRVARSRVAGLVIGWGLSYMSALLPVERVYETRTIIAFRHPRPTHKVHILIVPKRQVRSLLDLSRAELNIVGEAVHVAQRVIRKLGLQNEGYRLIVNGGQYQDVPHLHFHLVSGETLT
jgi:histidine triad (HIT) family protein